MTSSPTSQPSLDLYSCPDLDFQSSMFLLSHPCFSLEDQVLFCQSFQAHPEWVNQKDVFQSTPLIRASEYGRVRVVQALIDVGADLNLQDQNGWTALMQACSHGYVEIVKTLIQVGADLNLQDQDGWTSLMWASYYGYREVVQYLIHQGADPLILNHSKKTALNLAHEEGFDDLKGLLESYVAMQHMNHVINPLEEQGSFISLQKTRL